VVVDRLRFTLLMLRQKMERRFSSTAGLLLLLLLVYRMASNVMSMVMYTQAVVMGSRFGIQLGV
jgi:hypothetical protein